MIDIRENPFQCDCNIGSIVSNVIPLIMDKTPEFITEIRYNALFRSLFNS